MGSQVDFHRIVLRHESPSKHSPHSPTDNAIGRPIDEPQGEHFLLRLFANEFSYSFSLIVVAVV